MRAASLAALTALAALAAPSAALATASPDRPAYTVALRSDASGLRWQGREDVSFRNATDAPLTRVWLRLWDNGIRGCGSHAIEVSQVSGATPGALSTACTVLPLTLAQPIAPGARGTVGFALRISVPRRKDRFGVVGDEILLGNALPVLAIEDEAGVHLPPYVAFGESFYSVVGSYDVTLDVPDALALATTGARTSSRRLPGLRRQDRFLARQVRDFAWVAGRMHELDALSADGVRVRVWYDSATNGMLARGALGWARSTMHRYALDYGAYPYPEVDVVLVPFTTFGGMEYPTLVMTNAVRPVVEHELAHQWWYGIVGDDEYTAPWLDEAFATFAEGELDGVLEASCPSIAGDWGADDALVSGSMGYYAKHTAIYGLDVYHHGACALFDLRQALGGDRFDTMLRGYAEAHRFGFSTTADFIAAAAGRRRAGAGRRPRLVLDRAPHRVGRTLAAVPRYVIRGGREGYDRLRLLAGALGPATEALLDSVGIRAGMRCLDLGCGGGHVSLSLAARVGPSGHVVGIDMDAVKLTLVRERAAEEGSTTSSCAPRTSPPGTSRTATTSCSRERCYST